LADTRSEPTTAVALADTRTVCSSTIVNCCGDTVKPERSK